MLLRLICLVQHGQAGYIILHFAKGIQDTVAIGRHAGVISRFRELHLRAPRSAGENAFRDVGADGPEGALHVHQLGDICGLPAAISEKIQRRIIGRARNADLRIRYGHLPFGFGDVWPPLQQVGRQTGIECGRLRIQFFAGQVKFRVGFPKQDGDCVFKLFPLLQEQDRLRPRGVQQRLFLRHIQPGSNATFVPLVHQLQSALQRFHCAMQNPQLRIKLPQREVIPREFRSDHQPHVLEIGSGGLVRRLRCLNAAPPPAKEIHFIADRERQRNVCLRHRTVRGKVTARGTIARETLALNARRCCDRGELRGNLDSRCSAGLFQARRGNFDGLIRIKRLFFQRA